MSPVKARERADSVLAVNSQSKEGLVLRGESYISESNIEAGVKALKKAIKVDSNDHHLYLALGQAYVQARDFTSAEQAFSQALTIDVASIEAELALADLSLLTGRSNEAEKDYKELLQQAPQNDMLYFKLASFYQAKN
jgi:tetratricopeptide (TPR) repeat protein